MVILYGIKNCSTVRSAKKWLDCHNIDCRIHDYREEFVTKDLLHEFIEQLGWESIFNKKSLAYRDISAEQKKDLNIISAIEYMIEKPTLIKRPIVKFNDKFYIGFKAEMFEQLFL